MGSSKEPKWLCSRCRRTFVSGVNITPVTPVARAEKSFGSRLNRSVRPAYPRPSHNPERLARLRERGDRKIDVGLGQRGRHLRADTRLALRHDREEEPSDE